MESGIIYKVLNIINNKVYIGQTFRNFEKRKSEHIRKSKTGLYDTVLAKALCKYSEDNFHWSIVEDIVCTQEELDEREVYWINHYKCSRVYNGHGYNMTLGGGGTKGRLLRESTRLKMRNKKNRYKAF